MKMMDPKEGLANSGNQLVGLLQQKLQWNHTENLQEAAKGAVEKMAVVLAV